MLDGLAEIGFGRRRDPVGAPTEVDDVQIGLQHIVFGPLPRHLGRDHQFFGLAQQTAPPVLRGAHQRVLHVLLGDGGAALQITAQKVVLGRPGKSAERESRVGVEATVFGGDHRLTHVHRHLAEVDVDPIAFGRNDFSDFRAVAGQDCRDLVGTDVTRPGHVDDQVGHREGDDRQQDDRGRGQIHRASNPCPVDLLDPGHARLWPGGPGAGRPGRARRSGRPRRAAIAQSVLPRRCARAVVQLPLDPRGAPQRRRRRAV